MQWDSAGNKHYSSSLEAIQFLRDTSKAIVRWLYECRESGQMPMFPHHRSLLNDMSNVTIRWIEEQERIRSNMQDRIHSLERRIRELEGPAEDQQ